METNELIQQLASAIHHWLSYVSLCTNSNLLAESSVRYPFVEFLERKCGSAVNLEGQLEGFSDRHIDFCFKNGSDPLFVEIKYASKNTRSTAEKQRVFNDLVRLSLMIKKNANARGFFIMCGETQSFTVNFKRIIDGRKVKKNQLRQDGGDTNNEVEPQGDYARLWFKFGQDEEMPIYLDGEDNANYKKMFLKEYYGKDATVKDLSFKQIKTKRMAYLPTQKQVSQSQTVAIWEVTVIN